jgi:hypothetical protein
VSSGNNQLCDISSTALSRFQVPVACTKEFERSAI